MPSFHGGVRATLVAEWARYHARLGVSHVFFYDMGSALDQAAVLASLPPGLASIQTLKLPPPWDTHPDFREFNNAVWRADCLARARGAAARALFADVDEFVWPGSHLTLQQLALSHGSVQALSLGVYNVLVNSCGTADGRVWRPADPAQWAADPATWAAPHAWVEHLVFRTWLPVCFIKKATVEGAPVCGGWTGHRKLLVQVRDLAGLYQHDVPPGVSISVLNTSEVHILHFRGIASSPALCSTDTLPEPESSHLLHSRIELDASIPARVRAIFDRPLPDN